MKAKAPDSVWTNWIHFCAFGFGAGTIPFAPGTMGTLIAIPLYLLFANASMFFYLFVTIAAFVFGVWVCEVAVKDTGVPDHSGIVWDEIVGFFITMIASPTSFGWVLLGFAFFRLFDIWKPWPIRLADARVSGGFGVMLDDVIAGVYALIVMKLIGWIVLLMMARS